MAVPTLPVDDLARESAPVTGRRKIYPWVVFALAFGLLLSDYMSRQVLNAVFPLLKKEWALTDAKLATLSSVVALMVGLLTFPLSLLADRWGRVKSLVLMAVIWSAATLLCAVAVNYGQLLGARFLVGVGEAAYGSVGIAVVLSVFSPRLRSSLSGAFMAGGSFGSVLGVALGGILGVHLGWRSAFVFMAVFGLVLAALFAVIVRQRKVDGYQVADPAGATVAGYRAPLSSLFKIASINLAYVGSALNLFAAGVLLAWLPSFLNRYYGMKADRAGAVAAIFVLLIGAGMVLCGILTDRLSRTTQIRKWTTAIVYGVLAMVALGIGFGLNHGKPQLILIGIGAFFSAGASGPVTAMVANLTHPSIRATGFGTLTMVNSLLGLALGPFVVGVLADRIGLLGALRVTPLIYVGAIAALLIGRACYPSAVRKLADLTRRQPN